MLILAHPVCAKHGLEFVDLFIVHCRCTNPSLLVHMERTTHGAAQVCLTSFSSRISMLNFLNLQNYFPKLLRSLVPSIPNRFNLEKDSEL